MSDANTASSPQHPGSGLLINDIETLDRLELLCKMHDERIAYNEIEDTESDFLERSQETGISKLSGRSSNSIIVDRTGGAILDFYGLGYDEFEITEKRIVDYGAGRSNLLARFHESNRRIAIDCSSSNVRFQRSLGIIAVRDSTPTIPLESDTVDRFFATFSLPFWSHTPNQAGMFLREVIRVLKKGGRAHIGPITAKSVKPYWEQSLYRYIESGYSIEAAGNPWGDGESFDASAVLIGFLKELVSATKSGAILADFHYPELVDRWRIGRRSKHSIPTFATITKL